MKKDLLALLIPNATCVILQELEEDGAYIQHMKLFENNDYRMAYTDVMPLISNLSACSVRVAFTVAAYGDAQ